MLYEVFSSMIIDNAKNSVRVFVVVVVVVIVWFFLLLKSINDLFKIVNFLSSLGSARFQGL